MRAGIGLDIGGSWVRAALGDSNGRVLKRTVQRVAAGDPGNFVLQVLSIIKGLCEGEEDEIEGIGVGAAGRLDLKNGILEYSPHASLRRVALKHELEKALGKPVTLLNDCVAAALAELAVGAGKNVSNLAYIGIGTGIGGGAVVDGKVLLGKDGNAHEVGHMTVDIEGRLGCSCGGRGHWEAYTSGSGLPAYALLLSNSFGVDTGLARKVREGGADAKSIFDAARLGDPFGKFVVEMASEINSKGFANIVNLYDPQLITVGGGLALKNVGLVIEPIAEKLPSLCFNSPPEVKPTPLGEDAPLIGALVSVFEEVRERFLPTFPARRNP